MDVCPLHAAQALLLDGAPVSEVGAMNSLSRAVWRTSHDRFQLQIHNLTVETARIATDLQSRLKSGKERHSGYYCFILVISHGQLISIGENSERNY